MTSHRYILILCLLALSLASHSQAQQTQEQRAAYYYDRGEWEQAAELYADLYHNTTNKFYYQRLYATYLAMEEYRDALRLAERRHKDYPKELALFVDEGNVFLAQNEEKKAAKRFEKALEAITTNQAPIHDLARAFMAIGRYDYALRTYLTARERSRNRQLYFSEVVGVYQRMGDYEAMTGEYFDLLDQQPGMMGSIQLSMQQTLKEAPDRRLADGVRRELVARVRSHPDKRHYLEMMIWFALQEDDYAFALQQARAVDARFPEGGGEQLLRVARIALDNEAYDVAAEAFALLRQKGPKSPYYFESRVGELAVQFTQIERQKTTDSISIAALAQRYDEAIAELGRNEATVPLLRDAARLRAYHAGDIQGAVNILDDALEIPRLKGNLRDEVKLDLGDLLLFAGQVWDASLLYMQVEKANKNDLVGSMAKLRNARLSYFNHDFLWAKSQLEVLRASTSKLVANDAMELSLLISDNMEDDSTFGALELFADADLLLYQNRLDEAWQAFDRVAQQHLSHPLLDEVLMKKAHIRIRQGRYDEADSLLAKVVEFYPFDILADDALMLRGEINEEQLQRPTVAQQCYEKLLLDYPASLYVDRARKRYNQLKTR